MSSREHVEGGVDHLNISISTGESRDIMRKDGKQGEETEMG